MFNYFSLYNLVSPFPVSQFPRFSLSSLLSYQKLIAFITHRIANPETVLLYFTRVAGKGAQGNVASETISRAVVSSRSDYSDRRGVEAPSVECIFHESVWASAILSCLLIIIIQFAGGPRKDRGAKLTQHSGSRVSPLRTSRTTLSEDRGGGPSGCRAPVGYLFFHVSLLFSDL